jgi:predicted MFS family arabinose efflux permease
LSAPPTSRERQIVWTVALIQFVNVLDFVIVMPLGEDFAVALHIERSDIGFISGAYTGAAFLSGLISARFLDRFDRRPALLVYLGGLAIGTALCGVAQGFASMIAARIVAGVFGGPATSLSLAIVADVVPLDRRGRAMGMVMAGFSVASVLGVPAGLALARAADWRMPFFAVGTLAVLVIVVAAASLPALRGHLDGPRPPRVANLVLIRRPEVAFALATSAAIMFAVFIIVPNVPSYLIRNLGFPREHYELLYLAGGAASFLCLQVAGRWVDKAGPRRVMVAGTLISLTSIACGFMGDPLVPIPIAFVMFMASGSFRGVSQQTLGSRVPAPAERAQFMSLQSATQHAAMTAGAFVAAAILTTDPATKTIAPMWVVGSIALVLSAAAPLLLAACERVVLRRDASRPVHPAVSAAAVP